MYTPTDRPSRLSASAVLGSKQCIREGGTLLLELLIKISFTFQLVYFAREAEKQANDANKISKHSICSSLQYPANTDSV